MPLFEDLEERVARIEALKLYRLDDLNQAVLDLKKQEAALGRRVQLAEENLPHQVHAEVEAIGRRLHTIEDTWDKGQLQGLQEAYGEVVGRVDEHTHDTTHTHDLAHTHDTTHEHDLSHTHDTTHTHDLSHSHVNLEQRLASLEEEFAQRKTWDAQPWYQRWWRRLKGEQP